jgi:glycosyltransferase involved in cell wall biosynthesis
MATDFLLVIPAYRESNRLPPYLRELVAVLAPAPFQTEILIVDDGSPPDEHGKLLNALTQGSFGSCRVAAPLLLPTNQGKGRAILHGWRSASEAAWFGFLDADGAIPSYEVLRLLKMALSLDAAHPPCLWASRIRLLGRKIDRTLTRHLLGRIFATLVTKAIGLPTYDTQCGFKLIPHACYQKIGPLLEEPRFCFDIELLLAVDHAGSGVLEIPIDWRDVPGGHVHPVRDGIAMLSRLPAILERAKKWP